MKQLELLNLKNKNILPFRFKKLKSWKFFLSNDFGDWIVLSPNDFYKFIKWEKLTSDIENMLFAKNFLRNSKLDNNDLLLSLAQKYLLRYHYLLKWPSLHIIVVTLWCNQSCVYCHASAPGKDKRYNLTKEKAKKIVDVIFETTSGDITIEFQWGEPLYNWEIIKYIVEYAKEKNEKYNLDLQFALVSNLTLMDDEKLKYIVDNKIQVSTSLDGPKEVHDKNRPWLSWSSFDKVIYWIKRINEEYKKAWLDYQCGAITTATKDLFPKYKEFVDLFVELWLDKIFVRPLNPYGFAAKVWERIGYSTDDYMKFYNKMLNYIKELQDKWVNIHDTYGENILLTNLMSCQRVNYMEERSPCGAVLWQVAYNYDWNIYTCDEWRMLAEAGNDSFKIWEIDLDKSAKEIYVEMISSWITKIMLQASLIHFIPGYETNPISDYCWVCPIYSYTKSWNIVSKYRKEDREQLQETVLDLLVNWKSC